MMAERAAAERAGLFIERNHMMLVRPPSVLPIAQAAGSTKRTANLMCTQTGRRDRGLRSLELLYESPDQCRGGPLVCGRAGRETKINSLWYTSVRTVGLAVKKSLPKTNKKLSTAQKAADEQVSTEGNKNEKG